ncbi:MAG: hypothetical protein HFH41_07470 [Lachnospiraceae bacterium]|nr:hypothetical protein [Lachnospiraceae bacterium]
MQKYMLLGLLGLCSWEDMKRKELKIVYILLFGIGGMVLHLFYPVCSIYSILWGILLGVIMMLLSWISRGSIGMGDGILLVVTGIYLGGNNNLELFLTGLLLAALWSLSLLAFRKKNRKEEIAFVPFLLVSYITMILRWAV